MTFGLVRWSFLAILGLLPAFCAKQPIVETDLLKIGRVTEIQVTPDGGWAVYGVQTIHTAAAATSGGDPTYSYRTHLWLSDLRDANAKPVQVTFGERNDSMLAMSPDGRQLAFVRADEKKHPQVWLLPLGHAGEPRMVTTLEEGATAPRWRSDGKAMLVSSAVPLSKLPGKPPFDQGRPAREWWDFDRSEAKSGEAKSGEPDGDIRSIRDWLEHNAEHKDPSDLTRMAFLGELALNGELTLNELYRVDLEPEPKTVQLTSSFRSHNEAVFSPSGDRILFSALPDSREHPDRATDQSVIWEMKADGSQERVLVSQPGYSFRQALFAADGEHLVLVGEQNDQPSYRQSMLGRCDASGAHLIWLTPEGDSGVQQPQVARDGRIYYTVFFRGNQPLRSVDLKTKQIAVEVAGGVNAYAVTADKLVYANILPTDPNELYLVNRGSQETPRRLTDINAAWLADKVIVRPEEHWATRPDGREVQYWVMKPANAEPGKRYPWILDIHGGPSAMWGPGEFSMWHEFQMFCSFGYGVVYGNPRGSGGYGYAFQRANYKNWGEGPMGDVIATLDESIANYPMIDKDRLFVTGGSYAGYLTAWIVGHTNRFKAAAALRGVYDLSTFFGEGNAFRLVPEEFGGFPWEPETKRLLDQQSPLTYAANIVTPLLIIHGSSDNRTGVVQGQMLFRALKQLDRPVEYIRYPGAGHELTRSGPPAQRMDHMLRIIEFFERYAQNVRPTPQTSTGSRQTPYSGVQ